jgi:hypothetical protein
MTRFYAVNPNGHYYNGLKAFGNRYVMKFSLYQMSVLSASDVCQLLTDANKAEHEESFSPVKELKFFQLDGTEKTIQEISAIDSEENRSVEV